MSLDIDGILHVSAIEKRTGKSKQITITNTLQAKSEAEIAASRKRVEDLHSSRKMPVDLEDDTAEEDDEESESPADFASEIQAGSVSESDESKATGNGVAIDSPGWAETRRNALELIHRSGRLLVSMHAEDREEALNLRKEIEAAVASHDSHGLCDAVKTLEELLFFVEGT
jgi:molecular chaperone DnaK (HSP70)